MTRADADVTDLPEQLEQFAVELATGAADLVRRATGHGIDVSAKTTATDLVTQVDRQTEQWLRDRIEAARPGDGVLGEEGTGVPSRTRVRWIIDPIDGTVNFVLGLPQYSVSVAAEVDGVVVAGAVCNVALDETFRAHAGGGAWRGEQRLPGPRAVDVSRAVVGTGFAYDADMRARQAAVVAQLLPRIADIRRLGSAALDLCAVAAGHIDAYFEAGLHPWDYAAGALIATEAGCAVSGLRGRAPGSTFTAAVAPATAPAFFALLESLAADSVSSRS
jgi:myo-inositol-1(or 4)-monophosphatase